MNQNVLNRIEKAEKILGTRIQDIKGAHNTSGVQPFLQIYEYQMKQMEMTMTPQEIRIANEKEIKVLLEWYAEYQKLSPEQQKLQNEVDELELYKNLEQCKAWLNSEERRLLDAEYEQYQRQQDQRSTG